MREGEGLMGSLLEGFGSYFTNGNQGSLKLDRRFSERSHVNLDDFSLMKSCYLPPSIFHVTYISPQRPKHQQLFNLIIPDAILSYKNV
jgi:hypothetical protein